MSTQQSIQSLESIILTQPSGQGVESMGHVIDDLIDLMWDTQTPGVVDRIQWALDEFHAAYAGR